MVFPFPNCHGLSVHAMRKPTKIQAHLDSLSERRDFSFSSHLTASLYAYEVHAREVHAHEVYTREIHAYEVHAP